MAGKIIAIVPAAGIGRRFDRSTNKTFVSFNGLPLLAHTLKRLNSNSSVTEIIPVLREEDIQKGFDITRDSGLTKIISIAPGGQERQDSIYNALNAIKSRNSSTDSITVLVHDGARPVIPERTIEALIQGLKGVDGVAPGLRPRETLKKIDGTGMIISTIDRDEVIAIQTPQAFSFDTLKRAYDSAYTDGFYATDDAALIERTGGKVRIIEGSPLNIKVTTQEDLDIVECILEKENVDR